MFLIFMALIDFLGSKFIKFPISFLKDMETAFQQDEVVIFS